MNVDPTELIIRPITGPEELELFCQLPYVLDHELPDDLDQGRRRPAWLWVALHGDRLVARLAWWGDADADVPQLLDVLDLDDTAEHRVEVGVELLRTALAATLPPAATPPEYGRYVPPDWRDDPGTRRAVEDRMAVVERLGGTLLVERLRLDWLPGTPILEPSGRLSFRVPRGPEEIIELMTAVIHGTLDAHSLDDLRTMSAEAAAAAHFEGELARQVSPLGWWRVATLADGEPVGFVTPGRNHSNPVIGYLAVLPAHRGHGYIDEILAEGTRVLVAQDVPRIRAATDVRNVPMARAFERAGWINFERALHMTWTGGARACSGADGWSA